ncbi:MAG: hypothetical protein NUV57_00950 [archaeon]|nr:hypothetical protein [archaeon]
MKKGIIFSTDGILAMIVVIALFSALVVIGNSYTDSFQQPLLSTKTSDSVTLAYYTNGADIPSSAGSNTNVNCKQLFEYTASGLTEKVSGCKAK